MLKQNYLPTRSKQNRSLLLISLLILIYLFENSTVTSYIDNFIFSYILKPIIWVGMVFLIWNLPKFRPKAKLKHKSLLYFWTFNFAVIYVIITIIAGLIDGMGKSPYSHSPKGIFINIIFVGTYLVGREFIRNYLVHSFTKEENYLICSIDYDYNKISYK